MKYKTTFNLVAMSLIWMSVLWVPAYAQISGYVTDSEVTFRAKDEYDNGKGTHLKLLGVASINSTGIDCWDLKGKRSTALIKRVQRELSGKSIQHEFRYGFKLRYLIYDQGDRNDWIDFRSLVSSHAQFRQIEYGKGGRLNLAVIEASQQERDLAIAVNFDNANNETIVIPFAVGQLKPFAGRSIAITDFSKTATERPDLGFNSYRTVVVWTVTLNNGSDDLIGLDYSIYDLNRHRINYVDEKGNPVSALTYLSDPVRRTTPNTKKQGKKRLTTGKYSPIILTMRKEKEAYRLLTNVDPKQISNLKVSRAWSDIVLFDPVPLDPIE